MPGASSERSSPAQPQGGHIYSFQASPVHTEKINARVSVAAGTAGPADLIAAIEKTGFKAAMVSGDDAQFSV